MQNQPILRPEGYSMIHKFLNGQSSNMKGDGSTPGSTLLNMALKATTDTAQINGDDRLHNLNNDKIAETQHFGSIWSNRNDQRSMDCDTLASNNGMIPPNVEHAMVNRINPATSNFAIPQYFLGTNSGGSIQLQKQQEQIRNEISTQQLNLQYQHNQMLLNQEQQQRELLGVHSSQNRLDRTAQGTHEKHSVITCNRIESKHDLKRPREESVDTSNIDSSLSLAMKMRAIIPEEVFPPFQIPGLLDDQSLLHHSCRLYPTTASIVESALQFDPGALCRRVKMAAMVPSGTETANTKMIKERYALPINIALHANASLDVITALARHGPGALVMGDGPDGKNSLSIALTMHRKPDLVNTLIFANAECVQKPDRYGNYPLHTACFRGAPMNVIELLVKGCPEALLQPNFYNETPLSVVSRSTKCGEDIVDYLQETVFDALELKAYHLGQDELEDLDMF